MNDDVIRPFILTTFVAMLLKAADLIVDKLRSREVEGQTRRKNLYDEVDKLWARVDKLEKENDDLRVENVRLKERQAILEAENTRLTNEVARLNKLVNGGVSNAGRA